MIIPIPDSVFIVKKIQLNSYKRIQIGYGYFIAETDRFRV